MWMIPGKPVSPTRFQPFEPVDVLYEFDGPRIFTLWDSEGELNLAYWSDEDDAICRYVVVPTTDKIVAALRQGGVSVYDALNQPRCWLCDLTHLGEIVACRAGRVRGDSTGLTAGHRHDAAVDTRTATG